MKIALIGIVLAAVIAIGVTGCGSSKSACAEAIEHYYGLGCTLGDTQANVISSCESTNATELTQCGCKTLYDAALTCAKEATSCTCTPASHAVQTCMQNCSTT